MSRVAVAAGVGVGESLLRSWEAIGLLPNFDLANADDYLVRARVVAASRRGGATLRQVKTVLGRSAAERKEVTMADGTGRPGWISIALFDRDGKPVNDMKRRCEMLMPGYLRATGRPVAIAQEAQLIGADGQSAAFWGDGTGYDFRYEAYRAGVIGHPLVLPEVDTVDRGGAGKPVRSDERTLAANKTLQAVDRAVEAAIRASDGTLSSVEARRIVFDRDHELYSAYRSAMTRQEGTRDATQSD